MGNIKKSESWLTADELRVRMFARKLAEALGVIKLNAVSLHMAYESFALNHPNEGLDIEESRTVESWLIGKNKPNKSCIEQLKNYYPSATNWLTPNLDCALSRFFCAIDVSGAQKRKAAGNKKKGKKGISDQDIMKKIINLWAPKLIKEDRQKFIIPILNLEAPIPLHIIYDALNPVSILLYLYNLSSCFEYGMPELNEWIFDLATLSILVKHNHELNSKQSQTYVSEVYSLAYFISSVLTPTFSMPENVHEKISIPRYILQTDDSNESINLLQNKNLYLGAHSIFQQYAYIQIDDYHICKLINRDDFDVIEENLL